MAIIVSIDWQASGLTMEQERSLKHAIDYWRMSNFVPAFISCDSSIIITDISEKIFQYQKLEDLLRSNMVEHFAVGNLDLKAMADAAYNMVWEQSTPTLNLISTNNKQ